MATAVCGKPNALKSVRCPDVAIQKAKSPPHRGGLRRISSAVKRATGGFPEEGERGGK
jgi:hypothetical protein